MNTKTKALDLMEQLTPDKQDQVVAYIHFLLQQEAEKPSSKPKMQAGTLKGAFWVADDFDAPLEDFKDYM